MLERGKFSVRPRNDPRYYGGNIPFIQTGDVARAGRTIKMWSQTLNELGLSVSKLFPCGTIFMSIAANVGDVAISTFDAACPDSVVAISPLNGINHEWLFQSLLNSKLALSSLSTQNAQANLSLEKISTFKMFLAPHHEQRRIGEILRTWDEAIGELDMLITKTERLHRALTHSLVFGRSRLLPFRSSNATKTFRWFSLPTGWKCGSIGSFAMEISERHGEDEAMEVLSCSKYDGFVRSLEYFKKQVFSASLAGYKKIWRGDFGFPSNHVEEGSIGLQDIVDVGLVSPIYTVFRFAPDLVDNRYAYSVLKTSLYRHIFDVSTSASVDRRGSLRWTEFSSIPFPVPPLDEQCAIVEVISNHAMKLTRLSEQKKLLEQQKRGLMQKLLTGQWRVKA